MTIPAAHTIEAETIEESQLRQLLDRIDGTALIDAPPGLSDNVHTILSVVDEILVVTNPEIPAVSDAVKVSEAIKEMHGGRDNCWTVITKADELTAEVSDTEVQEALEMPIIARIPYDRQLKRAIQEQQPVVQYAPEARSAIAYSQLAADMANAEYEPPTLAPAKRALRSLKGKLP